MAKVIVWATFLQDGYEPYRIMKPEPAGTKIIFRQITDLEKSADKINKFIDYVNKKILH